MITLPRWIAFAGAIAMAASSVQAQDKPPQVERMALMKEIREQNAVLGRMAKGEAPFDAAEADAALAVIIDDIEAFPTYFPEGSESGHDTAALPAIWEDKAAFEARAGDLVEAANKAKAALPEGLEAFQGAYRDVGRACGACHNQFRAKQS